MDSISASSGCDDDSWIISKIRVERGAAIPYGAHCTEFGVNFSIFSRNAKEMILVLYNGDDDNALAEIQLDPKLNRTGDVWHIKIQHSEEIDTKKLRYNWRADGAYDTEKGLYYNKNNLLLDPYATAISGGEDWGEADIIRTEDSSEVINHRRCRIVSPSNFSWGKDSALFIPMEDLIIYELHVRGFTIDPSSQVKYPGTFLGLTEKIPYLKELGVNAVELMPVFEFDENENFRKNPKTGKYLLNYWGYSPLAFFCPNAGYSSQPKNATCVKEFKEMVKKLHEAGIEVYLDVVFNHTAEGDVRGPVTSFRGLDNQIYYMLDENGKYRNYSGCGNTFNCNHPVVRKLIIDVLRYWVSVMHVDGFRFDLASILGRGANGEVLANPPLLENIALDPILANTKLIAEAWDAGGVNLVGKFPFYGKWAEWNGYYRDDIRRFWRGEDNLVSQVASRVCGSDDLYSKTGRKPFHSINFITAHDGFTLNDLTSYNNKHNEDNGENNQDGENHNFSMNFGVEGVTDDSNILRQRLKQMKNFLATLLISQGVPMILAGDEFARTQKGNNNAYCQDNEISWINWSFAKNNLELLRFTKLMIKFRKEHPVLRRRNYFYDSNDIVWHGEELYKPDWSSSAKWLGFMLKGEGFSDDNLFILLNAAEETRHFSIPDCGKEWLKVVDTQENSPNDIIEDLALAPVIGYNYNRLPVAGRSLMILITRK